MSWKGEHDQLEHGAGPRDVAEMKFLRWLGNERRAA